MRDLTEVMSEILATNIRTLRLSIGLDQTQFGERLEVSQGTVSRWEKGSDPGHGSLVKMAAMARCTVEEFTTQVIRAPNSRRLVAGPPSIGSSILMLPVQLPSEPALSEMFQSLLAVAGDDLDRAGLASTLARLFPLALAETVYRQAGQADEGEPVGPAAHPIPPTGDRGGRSPQRT